MPWSAMFDAVSAPALNHRDVPEWEEIRWSHGSPSFFLFFSFFLSILVPTTKNVEMHVNIILSIELKSCVNFTRSREGESQGRID